MYTDSLKWCGDKLRMRKALFQGFLKPCSEKIVNHIRELLEEQNVKGTIKILLMVGGFFESEFFQEAIQNAFPEYPIPQEAGIYVLKSAMVFGHDPTTIDERKTKYNDRIQNSELVDPQKTKIQT